MKAMVLAAGLGTRLKQLTSFRPKALVEISNRTLLEIMLQRLFSFGIQDVVINVHHFANLVVEYLQANNNFGMKITISREELLLDTGGGLKKAAEFFLRDGDLDEPFILHNVDVLSSIDLGQMVKCHKETNALATLAVQDRKSSRHLLFDDGQLLCGRRFSDKPDEIAREARAMEPLAFSGIHVISPRLLTQMDKEEVFSIIPTYLRLASQGERIMAFRADEYYWRDLGKPESILQAEIDIKQMRL